MEALTKNRGIQPLSTVQWIILISTILMRTLQPQIHLDEVPSTERKGECRT